YRGALHAAGDPGVLPPRGNLGRQAGTGQAPAARAGTGRRRGLTGAGREGRARMKIQVVAVGVRMPAWVQDAWRDYARRLPRDCALELLEIKPEPRTSG